MNLDSYKQSCKITGVGDLVDAK
uniref:Uncharacterized protein n=1 Tax=Rhizophora mucronata TaxID=61149 RepID=A0A2P2NTD5_RHIMU